MDNYWITAPATVRTSVNNPKCKQFPVQYITKSVALTDYVVDPHSVFAVLHYEGADDVDPSSTPPIANGTQLLEHNFGM